MPYYIYSIEVEGVVRYIGITDNIKRRQTQHNYLLNKGYSKELYNKMSECENPQIELTIVKEFTSKIDAERWEALLILKDWFSKKQLWQSPPKKIKYF